MPLQQQPGAPLHRASRTDGAESVVSYVRAVRELQGKAGNRAAARMLLVPGVAERAHPTAARIARSVIATQVPPGAAASPGSTARSKRRRDVAARRKFGIEKVAPNATALAQLGGDYGITWPQQIRVTLGAKLVGNTWEPTVDDLIGEYSVQARILPHQTDITDASIATQANYQQLVTALDNLGEPGNALNYYSLKAVQAHESKHATRALQALMDVRGAINAKFAAVTVPRANKTETAAQAVARIQALPGYATALNQSFQLWDTRFDVLINGDHSGEGPCELAERSITVPLKNAIMERARRARWIAPPPQVPLT